MLFVFIKKTIKSDGMKNRDQINAFLGKDTEFEGKLSFKGTVRIDGRFTGEIYTDGTLLAGESALLKSDIHVSRIIISGEIRGNIIADKRVEIHAPGKVFGNIQSPVIVMDEGVIFEGNCRMQKIDTEKEKKTSSYQLIPGSKQY
jgi:cytoskeletal protein CcmA (bactofilin family)